MYLLDTNVVSELRKIRPRGAVVAWLESVADEDIQNTPLKFSRLT
jgi:predicted nucleic acid-binding protein